MDAVTCHTGPTASSVQVRGGAGLALDTSRLPWGRPCSRFDMFAHLYEKFPSRTSHVPPRRAGTQGLAGPDSPPKGPSVALGPVSASLRPTQGQPSCVSYLADHYSLVRGVGEVPARCQEIRDNFRPVEIRLGPPRPGRRRRFSCVREAESEEDRASDRLPRPTTPRGALHACTHASAEIPRISFSQGATADCPLDSTRLSAHCCWSSGLSTKSGWFQKPSL